MCYPTYTIWNVLQIMCVFIHWKCWTRIFQFSAVNMEYPGRFDDFYSECTSFDLHVWYPCLDRSDERIDGWCIFRPCISCTMGLIISKKPEQDTKIAGLQEQKGRKCCVANVASIRRPRGNSFVKTAFFSYPCLPLSDCDRGQAK